VSRTLAALGTVNSMEPAQLYAETRRRLIALAAPADVAVPALPGWTVQSTYAHVAGVCADVLDGRMEGAGSPEWTAAQVAARSGLGVDAVCAEWADRAEAFESWQVELGDRSMFAVYDVWTHHQDVRGAMGLAGERDLATELLHRALPVFDGRVRAAGIGAVQVGDVVLGDGAPSASIRTDDYSLMRMLFGRRSRTQIEAMDWDGAPDPFIDHLHLFDLPLVDLDD
jgi:uncharacterized protein (TIGR03083 family)